MRSSRTRFLTVTGLGAASFAIVRAPAKAAEIQLKFGNENPVDSPINTRSIEAFAAIKRESGGRVEVKAFPNNELGSDPAMIGQLRSGALEILSLPGAFLTMAPVTQIENVAFAFPNSQTVFKAMDGDLGSYIRNDIENAGIHVFDKIWENGYRQITSNIKPIHTVDDLKGLRIRVSPGKLRIDTFQSLGAAPTPLAVAELYTALQTHIVDAQENPLLVIELSRYFEVQKFCSLTSHQWSGYWMLFNKDRWNALPRDVQALFTKHMNAAAIKGRHDIAVLAGALQDKLRRQGLAFNTADTTGFRDRLNTSGYYQRWQKEFGAKPWSLLEQYVGKLG